MQPCQETMNDTDRYITYPTAAKSGPEAAMTAGILASA